MKEKFIWKIFQNYKKFFECLYFLRNARLLGKEFQNKGLEEIYNDLRMSKKFFIHQNKFEILEFIKLIKLINTGRICEIGTAEGGNLILLTHAVPTQTSFLSIDIRYPSQCHKLAFPLLIKSGTNLQLLEANSSDPDTVIKMQSWLDSNLLDVLFIDGDHSYNGVQRDYEIYSPFIRKGGIIAFHDIVLDSSTRFGIKSQSYVGDVPRYWKELKSISTNYVELVESSDQDGKGIGVIYK